MKLRRYHRWLATIFGVLILWIATTGIITQSVRIYSQNQPRAAEAAPLAAPPTPAPPQTPVRKVIKFVTDLHSGERFGLVGQLISLTSGCALLFLSGSGLWMYIRMFRARAAKAATKVRSSQSKWFWT